MPDRTPAFQGIGGPKPLLEAPRGGATWLPLADEELDGTWMLHVTLGSTPLAITRFEWLQVGGVQRARFNGDGEIDAAKVVGSIGTPEQPENPELVRAQAGVVSQGWRGSV